jgi:FtsH-binding integral membrane protein
MPRHIKIIEMNKKFASVFSVLILVVFIGYIIFDTSRPAGIEKKAEKKTISDTLPEKWKITA